MNGCRFGIVRKAWDLPFLAEAGELVGLRRVMRLHLELWGLPDVVHSAQICVTEMAANVIKHVGSGTPTRLDVFMSGSDLRIEMSDPDTRALPTLIEATDVSETGRGLALIDGIAERWGVILRGDSKVIWCELATGLPSPVGHVDGPRVAKAEAVLGLLQLRPAVESSTFSRLSVASAEMAAIDLIADLLHWLRAHGCDPDSAMDRAQTYFEADLPGVS
ncbi:ATP-binding protein [Streptomyces finlayi]|uniref:ATP-binding protein n=2 Tax=Streptomyces finlayi TaxID=67296 RepID=A0A7G7BVM1_9ACTN|nr:ATP-binding protein [Streptomyces finlayi]